MTGPRSIPPTNQFQSRMADAVKYSPMYRPAAIAFGCLGAAAIPALVAGSWVRELYRSRHTR